MIRLGIGVACILACGVADARPASTGFFAEGGLAVDDVLEGAGKYAATGPGLAIRVGRDLFSWLSIGGYVAASTHEATVPPPPAGQYFQLYRAGGDGRINIPIGPMSIFAEGGFGATMISSNVLQQVMLTKAGSSFSATIHGGGGLEYQLENRHYGVGLAADGYVEPEFKNMKVLEGRLYLRYTYGGG